MKRVIKKIFILTLIAVITSCGVKEPKLDLSEEKKESTESKGNLQDEVGKIVNKTIDPAIYLDYKKGIEEKVYKWIRSEDGTYYTLVFIDGDGNPVKSEEAKINVGVNNKERINNKLEGDRRQGEMPGGMLEMMVRNKEVYQGTYINANITNLENQTMLVYVPTEYFDLDDNDEVIGINYDNKIGHYTAGTAPIIFLNECGGWRSSSPRGCDTTYIEEGYIYVTCGARSRDAMSQDGIHTGKAPMQMADLKSGIIELRANDEIIPGDKNKIISIGTSGGGQMSSILGASGDMPEYYLYMYEAGTLGVTKNSDGTYSSKYKDSIFAAQNYCPIADIENADLAYAWWWIDLVDDGGVYNGKITPFEKRLQELEADAYVTYLNSLKLKDKEGKSLTLTGYRSGTYYNEILKNLSISINKYIELGELDVDAEYGDYSSWLKMNEDTDEYEVTDLKGFMIGTGLVNKRNKAIPGFDPMDKTAENDAFGKANVDAVHFSKSVAKILKENYNELSQLEGFNEEQEKAYIEDALDGESASYIERQTALLNATQIMLNMNGLKTVNPVKHFRNRSGTADQHTSFSVGYNMMLAASSIGIDVDYALVWNMGHGNNEGETTGTFIDWVNEICK